MRRVLEEFIVNFISLLSDKRQAVIESNLCGVGQLYYNHSNTCNWVEYFSKRFPYFLKNSL